jgi:hypothetical protein
MGSVHLNQVVAGADHWLSRRLGALYNLSSRTVGNTACNFPRSSRSPVRTTSPRWAAEAITTASVTLGPLPSWASERQSRHMGRSPSSGSTSHASSSRATGPRCPRHHSTTTGAGTVIGPPRRRAPSTSTSARASRRSSATRAPVSRGRPSIESPALSPGRNEHGPARPPPLPQSCGATPHPRSPKPRTRPRRHPDEPAGLRARVPPGLSHALRVSPLCRPNFHLGSQENTRALSRSKFMLYFIHLQS